MKTHLKSDKIEQTLQHFCLFGHNQPKKFKKKKKRLKSQYRIETTFVLNVYFFIVLQSSFNRKLLNLQSIFFI